MRNQVNWILFKERKHPIPRKPRIGVLMGEKSNPFWSEMKHYFEVFAPQKGIEIQFYWPLPIGDTRAQMQLFRHILALGFDLIIINPLNRNNLVPRIIQACRQKIPVLDVGAKTDPDLVSKAKPYYFPVHTVDFYRQGGMGARHIIKKIRSFKSKKVVILEGREDAAQSRGRSQGAADAFAEEKSIQVIKREPADFERLKAKKIAIRILSETPGVSAFFCANDLMALGVADALRGLKDKRKVIIVGVDLIPEARKAIQSGRMEASVAFSTASVAKAVLRTARKVLAERSISIGYLVKSSLVTKKNLDSWKKRNLPAGNRKIVSSRGLKT
jgi:ABC-type sugar transport system substrate-binding protein